MTRSCWNRLFIAACIAAGITIHAAQPSMGQEEKSPPVSSSPGAFDAKAEAIKASQKLREIDIVYADAMRLFERHRYLDALPMLEKLAAKYPSDLVALERLGVCLIVTDNTLTDADQRKKQRARGRQLLARARDLGAHDELSDYYLSVIPEDGGSDIVFSNRPEVNEAMREGEKAFSRSDFDAAIKAYTQAMLLDPTMYSAVLFIGDSYFAKHQYPEACEWFERATKLNPDVETAYRYWGDALMRLDQADEAGSRFIEAVIAEPYNRRPWVGLKQWADARKIQAAHPDIKAPQRPKSTGKEDGSVNIVIDAKSFLDKDKKDGTAAWAMYQIIAGAWQGKLFKEKYPGEAQYRHTLEEEASALSATAASVAQSMQEGDLKPENLDAGIATLLKLHKSGMLEPFILLSRPDEGIAKDYPSYREKYRDKLRQYVKEFIIPTKP